MESKLTFKNGNITLDYLSCVPAALAIERLIECHILESKNFIRPVLDIGCGDGLFAKVLFADQIDEGLDYDASETARAAASGKYLHLTTDSATQMPFPEASFATVFSNSVLEHIPEVERVVNEAFRVLKPGGIFYFTVPSPLFEEQALPHRLLCALGLKNQAAAFGKAYNAFWRHYNVYDLEGWCSMASDAGFQIQEAFSYCPANAARLNDLLAPLAFPSAITRRIFNRWVLLPKLRRAFLLPIAKIINRRITTWAQERHGVLCYVAAMKPNSMTTDA